ncbi:MAG: hypothetical protein REI11_05400, partial [Patulibacter sp.]|nr:hypothetical protein [Patulibacter sp.]
GASNKVSAHGAAVRVSHAFTTDDITTRYSIRRGKATQVLLRLPVWGRSSTVVPELGVSGKAGAFRRTGSSTVRFLATTAAGAQMRISYDGIPATARIDVVSMRPMPRAPAGVQQIEIRFRAGAATHLTRTLDILQGEAP